MRTARRIMAAALVTLAAIPVAAIDRTEVIDRAKGFAYHPWTCGPQNLTASCLSGYQSEYVVGDHLGLPYDWGGYVSLHEFDLDIENGKGAGTPPGGDTVSCTTGLDCSKFVSQCWDIGEGLGTYTIMDVSDVIDRSELVPGDALNYPGYHIVLYAGELADGTPLFYEANPPNVHLNWFSGWAAVEGFTAIRYKYIDEGGSDLGTFSNPIPIAFPYTDSRDTRESPGDLVDACGAVPGTDESGREYVYAFTIDTPGHFRATVSDGDGVDIDLHLYTHFAERDCFARHDNLLELDLTACGTYFLVLDTWVDNGEELAGAYTLNVTFTPTGGACGSIPDYDFLGGPGDRCASPSTPNEPFCNPNLMVWACVYITSPPDSYCSRFCERDADCTGDFPGGCCQALSGGELVCKPEQYCPAEQDGGLDGGPDGGVPDAGPDAGGDAGTDAGVDAGADAGVDAGVDAGADAGADNGADTGSDAGSDAGSDPGQALDSGPCPDGWHLVDDGCVPDNWEPESSSCSCSSKPEKSSGLLLLLAGWLLWETRRKRTRDSRVHLDN